MKTLAIVMLICTPLMGQVSPNNSSPTASGGAPCGADDFRVKELTAENAQLKIKLSSLQMNALQQSANTVVQDHKNAVESLEHLYPGTRWDDQSQKLVPIPAPVKDKPADKK